MSSYSENEESFSSNEMEIEIVPKDSYTDSNLDLIFSECQFLKNFEEILPSFEYFALKSDDIILGVFGLINWEIIKNHINSKRKNIDISKYSKNSDNVACLINERIFAVHPEKVVEIYKKIDFKYEYYVFILKMQDLTGQQANDIAKSFKNEISDKVSLKSIPCRAEEIFLMNYKISSFVANEVSYGVFVLTKNELLKFIDQIENEIHNQ